MVTNQYMPHSPANLNVPLAELRDYFVRHQIFYSFDHRAEPPVADSGRAWTHQLVQRMKHDAFLEEGPGRLLRPGPRFLSAGLRTPFGQGMPIRRTMRPTLACRSIAIWSISLLNLCCLRCGVIPWIDAGIHEGDFVVIERTRTPTVGDTVLALVDNTLTLKIFAEDANGRFLRGARSASW